MANKEKILLIEHQHRPIANVSGKPDLHLTVTYPHGNHLGAKKIVEELKEITKNHPFIHIMWETDGYKETDAEFFDRQGKETDDEDRGWEDDLGEDELDAVLSTMKIKRISKKEVDSQRALGLLKAYRVEFAAFAGFIVYAENDRDAEEMATTLLLDDPIETLSWFNIDNSNIYEDDEGNLLDD
ncbi:hypothetical protein LCGC14_1122540 [marine sediment metagenome]|uniref:Uncharacterized protein n=1 Tax=marine sediment metagenome TaxID=412755 RepID=A0A0F9M3I7_9ZZZZ